MAFIAAAITCSGGRFGRRAAGSGRPYTLALAAGILIVHSLISSKNLRYVISADPFMRLLVASAFPRKWFVVVNAAVELSIFYIIFIANNVYDPVTDELLRALHMLPV